MRSVLLRSRQRRLERRYRRRLGGIVALPIGVALGAVLLFQIALNETTNVASAGGEVALAPPLSVRVEGGDIIVERAGERWRRELGSEAEALDALLDSLRGAAGATGNAGGVGEVIVIASSATATSDLLRVIEGVRRAGYPHISLYAAPIDSTVVDSTSRALRSRRAPR